MLKRLEGSSALNLSISPDEASLFADARDGKLDQWSFAEAALLGVGRPDAPSGARHTWRGLAAIEAEARQAVGVGQGARSNAGAALLRFLHAARWPRATRPAQTNVSTILDTGTFNCVSSAALYNMLGAPARARRARHRGARPRLLHRL